MPAIEDPIVENPTDADYERWAALPQLPIDEHECQPLTVVEPPSGTVWIEGMPDDMSVQEYLRTQGITNEDSDEDEPMLPDPLLPSGEEIFGEAPPDESVTQLAQAREQDVALLRREHDAIMAIEDSELMQARLRAFKRRLEVLMDDYGRDSELGHALAGLAG